MFTHSYSFQSIHLLFSDAQPQTFSGNGHLFWTGTGVGIGDSMSFDDCVAKSETVLGGLQGYLATITTESELVFVVNTMGIRNAWISLTDATEEGTFRFISGPEAGTQLVPPSGFWASGEPNNGAGSEDCANIDSNGVVNDNNCNSNFACLIELQYSADASAASNHCKRMSGKLIYFFMLI